MEPKNQPKKRKKIGRPKLPKGQAKGRFVPVRFKAEDFKAMKAAAKDSKQSISEWIRATISDKLEGKQ